MGEETFIWSNNRKFLFKLCLLCSFALLSVRRFSRENLKYSPSMQPRTEAGNFLFLFQFIFSLFSSRKVRRNSPFLSIDRLDSNYIKLDLSESQLLNETDSNRPCNTLLKINDLVCQVSQSRWCWNILAIWTNLSAYLFVMLNYCIGPNLSTAWSTDREKPYKTLEAILTFRNVCGFLHLLEILEIIVLKNGLSLGSKILRFLLASFSCLLRYSEKAMGCRRRSFYSLH